MSARDDVIAEQLNMLGNVVVEVDGVLTSIIPRKFSEIIIKRSDKEHLDTSEKIFVFEDYIIKPFDGFDFHKKFNKDVPPPEKTMYGIIIRETDKMYLLKVHSLDSVSIWQGFCPKKSVKILDR